MFGSTLLVTCFVFSGAKKNDPSPPRTLWRRHCSLISFWCSSFSTCLGGHAGMVKLQCMEVIFLRARPGLIRTRRRCADLDQGQRQLVPASYCTPISGQGQANVCPKTSRQRSLFACGAPGRGLGPPPHHAALEKSIVGLGDSAGSGSGLEHLRGQ